MIIKRFEEIDAWKEARRLTAMVYRMTANGAFAGDFGLRDQIRRASTSTLANISEGFDSSSNREFLRFLHYSKRSASEVQSHLYVALDQRYMSLEAFEETFEQARLTKDLVGGFIRYLLGKPNGNTVAL